MNSLSGREHRWGVRDIFLIRTAQGNLITHEQRLRLKNDGRPCPPIKFKGRTSASVYKGFSWICGGENDEGKSTYFCWPCLVMGDISTVRDLSYIHCYFEI